MMELAKVEKKGRVAVNLKVKFFFCKMCLLQYSESFSQAYKGLM